MKKTNASKVVIEYRRERERVRRAIRRLEKRGYTVEAGILPKVPKRITQGSVRRLKKITTKSLYEHATYRTAAGDVISGKKRRLQERAETASKGRATRRRNKVSAPVTEKEILKSWLANKVDEVGRDYPATASLLQGMIDDEISKYGEDAFYRSIKLKQSEVIESIDVIMTYGSASAKGQRAVRWLARVIRGTSELEAGEERELNRRLSEEEEWNEQ